jgi:predicted amidohydrolase YtcJ
VVRTPADVEEALDVIRSIGGIGVKLSVEHGFNPLRSLPTYTPEVSDAIVRGAAARGLPVYVHAMSERDAQVALDLGAHAIMHAPMGGLWTGQFLGSSDISDAFVARMVKSRAYQVTTFSLIDTWPNGYDTRRLHDPLVRLTVPAVELATARDPEAARFFTLSMLGSAVPWTFEFTRPWMARHLWSAENLQEGLRYSQRNVLKLYRAGVPVVAATDAPSYWPLAIYHFHGPQTVREVELLAEAGLSPIEAIAAATRVPAQMLGIDRDVGTVEVGKRADLLIVAGDPLADLRALRSVRWTVKEGVAHTPEEWMQPAPLR